MGDRVTPRLLQLQLVGNLIGAVLAFSYFRFVDFHPPIEDRPLSTDVAYFVVGTAFLLVAGVWAGLRLSRPLRAARAAGRAASPAEAVRRRALALPYWLAGVTGMGWVLAGILWGVILPAVEGSLSAGGAARRLFGIAIVGGSTTAAFIFFSAERVWRSQLPELFPEGDLRAVAGVPRLPVRARLLTVFLMISLLPMALLSVLAFNRASQMRGADPAVASAVIQNMVVAMAFIFAAGAATAIGLSVFVSRSVAAPLRELEVAMRAVERGNLQVRCDVVSNDEIGAVTEGFNSMLRGLRERDAIKEMFGKYVTPEIRDEILAGRVALEGQAVEVTILFSDLRDFTPWVESSAPGEVVRDLNAYFTEMEEAIRSHKGIVLQFVGDEIEAVFGAPLPNPGHAEAAVRAALDMRERLRAFNARRAPGGRPLRHGIGIHTGTVLAGNIGSSERLSYALVGDAVNLASRIQGLNKEFGSEILVSGVTRDRLDGLFPLHPLPAVRVKGKSLEVEVYRVA
ncbi:MAG TPA: adenylate/guanylate cyclase domain-containing protein, partial [Candidatus Methylomirabilis sp.]|nr:adenylate/guanylate cyclase domain-containing protein [Candidatus Methylomirabilis sp.]